MRTGTTAHQGGGEAIYRSEAEDKFARPSARSRATASVEFGGFRDARAVVKVASLRLQIGAATQGENVARRRTTCPVGGNSRKGWERCWWVEGLFRTKRGGAFRLGGAICALRARAPCYGFRSMRLRRTPSAFRACGSFARRERRTAETWARNRFAGGQGLAPDLLLLHMFTTSRIQS
jgi:hypothetical protein